MFEAEEIKAYRNLKAPEELQDRILAMEKPKKLTFQDVERIAKPVIRIAAVLVLIVSLSSFIVARRTLPDITVDGSRLTTKNVEITSQTTEATGHNGVQTATLTRERDSSADNNAQVLTVIFSYSGQIEGAKKLTDGSYEWSIADADTKAVYELPFQEKNKQYSMIVQFDEASQNWTLHLERRED